MVAGVDWGSVPEWFAFAAALVALLTFLSSRRDRAREQASAVYVETTRFRISVDRHRRGLIEATATIRNTSRGQIVDVGLALYAPGRRTRWWWARGKRAHWWTGERLLGRVYPTIRAQSIGTPTDVRAEFDASDLTKTPNERPAFVLEFTDANGRRWVRWPHGEISSVRRSTIDNHPIWMV